MEGSLHEMFGSGRMAMNIGNYWNRNFYKAQMGEDDEFRMAPLPAGPVGRFQQYVAGCLSILKSTRSPQEAFEWIKYFTSHEINLEYVDKGFNIGTRPAVNQDPRFADDPFVQQFLPIYEVRPYNLPGVAREPAPPAVRGVGAQRDRAHVRARRAAGGRAARPASRHHPPAPAAQPVTASGVGGPTMRRPRHES